AAMQPRKVLARRHGDRLASDAVSKNVERHAVLIVDVCAPTGRDRLRAVKNELNKAALHHCPANLDFGWAQAKLDFPTTGAVPNLAPIQLARFLEWLVRLTKHG